MATLKKSLTGNSIVQPNDVKTPILTGFIKYDMLIKCLRREKVNEEVIDAIRQLVANYEEELLLNEPIVMVDNLEIEDVQDVEEAPEKKPPVKKTIAEQLNALKDFQFSAAGETTDFLLFCEQMLVSVAEYEELERKNLSSMKVFEESNSIVTSNCTERMILYANRLRFVKGESLKLAYLFGNSLSILKQRNPRNWLVEATESTGYSGKIIMYCNI